MVVLARAPLRVSFLGGGSDIGKHFFKHGNRGATLSIAIDKYVYVAASWTPNRHVKLSYMQQERVSQTSEVQHDLVRRTLEWYKIDTGIEINTWADVPTVGSGLGGSSSFTCALIQAINFLVHGKQLPAYEVAYMATQIEGAWGNQSDMGYQDQYASAYGGFNYIEYYSHPCTRVNKQPLGDWVAEYCVLIPIGGEREALKVLGSIDFGSVQVAQILNEMADMATQFATGQNLHPRDLGHQLNDAWELKKNTSHSISNPNVDFLVNDVKQNFPYTFWGCKLLGAGGSGYLLVMSTNPQEIARFYNQRPCLLIDMDERGACVVYHD